MFDAESPATCSLKTSSTRRSTDGLISKIPSSKIAPSKDYYSDYCYLLEFEARGLENNCHDLVAYSFLKGLEDLQARFGYDVVRTIHISILEKMDTEECSEDRL